MYGSSKQQGFTLVELIAVIILIAILAGTATSRFNFDYADLQATRDDIVTGLFYAQQIAMARDSGATNTGVYADLSDNSRLRIYEGATLLRDIPYSGDVAGTSTSNSIYYDKLGRLETPGQVTISLDGTAAITVEETGFVH